MYIQDLNAICRRILDCHLINLISITVDNCNHQLVTRGIKSQHEFVYKVSNYSFTIWYMVFYKHGGGTAIFRLI